jgi:3-(3-hydroxy-phenyl)propionate hydroxylase
VHAFIELAVQLGAIIQTTDAQAARERDARFRGGSPRSSTSPPRLGPGSGSATAAAPGGPVGQVSAARAGRRPAAGRRHRHRTSRGSATRPCWRSAVADTRTLGGAWGGGLPASGAGLHDWLDRHHVRAVLLRPDRYVAGVARTAADLACADSACLPRVRAVAA